MNASHYALVALALGVLLLGRLPTGPPPRSAAREPAERPAASALAEAERLPAGPPEARRADTRSGAEVADTRPAQASAAESGPRVREDTVEPSPSESRLWEAELGLMRALGAQGARRAPPSSASCLDELARLITWKGRVEERGPATIVIRPTRDRSLGSASSASTLRR